MSLSVAISLQRTDGRQNLNNENAENERQENHDKVNCRPHLNGENQHGMYAGSGALVVRRRLGITESPGTASGARHQLSESVCFFAFGTLSDVIKLIRITPKF